MKIISAFAVGLTLAGAISAAPAQAQNVRTFVSGLGNDTNSCSIIAPCRTLQGALNQTNAQGEIIILDNAGYAGGGTVRISKAISIINQGGFAGISVAGGQPGIEINANLGDTVSLLGLTIDGYGDGSAGILFNSGSALIVENCVVRRLRGDGIDFYPTTANAALTVSNSLVDDNGGLGISVFPQPYAVLAVFSRVVANNNGLGGILVDGTSTVSGTTYGTVSESVAAGNGLTSNAGYGGFSAVTSGGPTSLVVSHSVAANNGIGVTASGSGATLRLANSTVSGNINGWEAQNSGVVDSYGDNYIDANPNNNGAPPKINAK